MTYYMRCLDVRAVFSTLSNIYDGAFFAKLVDGFSPFIIFQKTFRHRCLAGT